MLSHSQSPTQDITKGVVHHGQKATEALLTPKLPIQDK